MPLLALGNDDFFTIFWLDEWLQATVINVDKVVWLINQAAYCFALNRIYKSKCPPLVPSRRGPPFPFGNVFQIYTPSLCRFFHLLVLRYYVVHGERYVSKSKQPVERSRRSPPADICFSSCQFREGKINGVFLPQHQSFPCYWYPHSDSRGHVCTCMCVFMCETCLQYVK